MKAKLLILLFITILGTIFFFRYDILDFWAGLTQQLPQLEQRTTDLLSEKIEGETTTPSPLRVTKENPQSFLTQAGIIQWTNIQREGMGLPLLSENTRLNAAAEMRLEDMFEKQYFAHVSPFGLELDDLAKNTSYEFIALGENLAMGDFKDDKELVLAWMDSPDHRATILSSRYRDIGVAVGRSIFEGQSRWLAVQIFGLSLSLCSQPDEKMKAEIGVYTFQIEELQKKLESLQKEIQNMKPKFGSIYNKKVNEYNALVVQYNNLIAKNKALISKYNAQVGLFNQCVSK